MSIDPLDPIASRKPCQRCGKDMSYGGLISKKHRYKYVWRDYCKFCGKWQRYPLPAKKMRPAPRIAATAAAPGQAEPTR